MTKEKSSFDIQFSSSGLKEMTLFRTLLYSPIRNPSTIHSFFPELHTLLQPSKLVIWSDHWEFRQFYTKLLIKCKMAIYDDWLAELNIQRNVIIDNNVTVWNVYRSILYNVSQQGLVFSVYFTQYNKSCNNIPFWI